MLKNKLTKNIKPSSTSIIKTKNDLEELFNYFKEDVEKYVSSLNDCENFIEHWNMIMHELNNRDFLKPLVERVIYHKSLRNYKITSIRKYLNFIWNIFTIERENIMDEFEREINQDIYNIDSLSLNEEQKSIYEKYHDDYIEELISLIGIIQGMINVGFIAYENSCKIISAFGCYTFSTRYANNITIHHREIWKSLKYLAKIDENTKCNSCLLDQKCNFKINFNSLANIYCYVFIIRNLSNYDDLFYKIYKNIFSTTITDDIEILNNYFINIENVIKAQIPIEDQCMRMVT